MKWITPERKPTPLLDQLLINRGVEDVEAYLHPTLQRLHSPWAMHGMEKAAHRIALALHSGSTIVVYGDYDVDGVTATATLYHALKFLGGNVVPYIPHRIEEGYGLQTEAVCKIHTEHGPCLVVTVDCGITAVEQANQCLELGIDLIITDHHEWKESLPDAFALVHPRLGETPYPNPLLCGAGVAHKVAWAVGLVVARQERVDPDYADVLRELLCFTALGTIADVVPLTGENRVIAHNGLSQLPRSTNVGLRALLESARLTEVDGYAVGFMLAPRLNAAGRLGHAKEALELFTTATRTRALEIATELERKNKERQELQADITKEALAEASLFPHAEGVVVAGRGWHPGVVGIVASRLVETFNRPSIVLVEDGEHCHGSGRSVEGFNLAAALKATEEWLERWGGHGMACGLRLPSVKLPAFRMAFQWYCQDKLTPEQREPVLPIDAEVQLHELTIDVVRKIKALGPFGIGNRRVLLSVTGRIEDERTMGKEQKHLMFYLAQGPRRMKCVMWNGGYRIHALPRGEARVAVEPQLNVWRDSESVELLVRDIVVA